MRLLNPDAIVAAAGPAPRPLAALTILAAHLDDDGRTVTLQRELHPALRSWLTNAGWDVTTTSAHATPPRTANDPLLAPVAATNGKVAAAVMWGAKRRDAASAELRIGAGRLTVADRAVERLHISELAHRLADVTETVAADHATIRAHRTAAVTLHVTAAENPAQAVLRVGGSAKVATATRALAVVNREHVRRSVDVADDVIDVASIAASAAAGRPDLFEMQDEAVSALTATDVGAVLAAAPGSGKTVIAAAALNEMLTDQDRCLVAAPAGVTRQWADELHRWAPKLAATVAVSVGQLRRGLPQGVTVTSHDIAADWAATARTRLACVIVDEAAVLLTDSPRAKHLWRLRGLAARGWALTGTPGERNPEADVAELVGWARHRPRRTVPAAPAERFEPILVGVSKPAPLPAQELHLEPIVANAADQAMLAEVAHIAAAAPSSGLRRHQAGELIRRMLGHTARHTGRDAPGAKHTAVVERLTAHAALGDAALVFSTSNDALIAVVAELKRAGVTAAMLRADARRQERVATLAAFSTGQIAVLGVTPASQRGVNLQRANLVAHLDLPATHAQFAQRNARAARIGSPHQTIVVWVPYLDGSVDEQWAASVTAGDPAELVQVAGTAPR